MKIHAACLPYFACSILMLIGAGLPGNCDAAPYQSHDAFTTAILDKSTSPYIVLIEVIDDRTGQSSFGCNTANMLKGASYREKWGAFGPNTPETRARFEQVDEIALANTSHVFHFSNEAALRNVLPLRYPEACAAIGKGKRARIADMTGKPVYGPFAEGPSVDWRLCPTVPYPLETKLTTETGTSLSLFIGPDGTAKEVKVTGNSGSPLLDETIRTALAACRFKPRTIDGVPVPEGAHMSLMMGSRAPGRSQSGRIEPSRQFLNRRPAARDDQLLARDVRGVVRGSAGGASRYSATGDLVAHMPYFIRQ